MKKKWAKIDIQNRLNKTVYTPKQGMKHKNRSM